MWRHIFNINIAVIFEIFFLKTLDIGNYQTEEDDQSYLDFVGHQLKTKKLKKMKEDFEDFVNSSG
jgi:hypothetical protein